MSLDFHFAIVHALTPFIELLALTVQSKLMSIPLPKRISTFVFQQLIISPL